MQYKSNLNPLYIKDIIYSVKKTRRLIVVDPGWISGGFSAELVAKIVENLELSILLKPPVRIALPHAPAPTPKVLEDQYYTTVNDIIFEIKKMLKP